MKAGTGIESRDWNWNRKLEMGVGFGFGERKYERTEEEIA